MGSDHLVSAWGEPLEFISRNFTLGKRTMGEAPHLDCSEQGLCLGQAPGSS